MKACPTEAWDTVHGYIVSFGGLFGNSIHKGEPIIPFIADKEKLLKICDAAVQFLMTTPTPENGSSSPWSVWEEKFEEKIWEAYNG